MSNLYIEEYTNVEDGVPVAPPAALQVVAVSPSVSAQSSTFQNATNYVVVVADTAVSVQFGTSPTAVFNGGGYIPSQTRQMFRVPNGQSYKIAVIASN